MRGYMRVLDLGGGTRRDLARPGITAAEESSWIRRYFIQPVRWAGRLNI